MSRLSLRSTWVHLLALAFAVAAVGDGAARAQGGDRAQRLHRLDARLRSDSLGTRSAGDDEAVIWGSTDTMTADNTAWKTPPP